MTHKPQVILVGGFLGAGKTTLISKASRILRDRGLRVGVVTNDQAANLVDTGLIRLSATGVSEVAGGCFCCRFEDFLGRLETLRDQMGPDVLIGEPVGSCTDLSATVLQPLKEYHDDLFRTAPFSVLVEPDRLRDALAPHPSSPFPDSVVYIYDRQLEEADAIVLTKTDLLSDGDRIDLVGRIETRYPESQVFALSAETGEGVAAWLDYVLGPGRGGRRIADVDYDLYAEGEAELGWLNGSARITAARELSGGDLCLRLLESIRDRLLQDGSEIAHAKVLLSTEAGVASANLTTSRANPRVRGECVVRKDGADLIVNVRAHIDPPSLEGAVRAAFADLVEVEWEVRELQCFSPGRPVPVHRFASVVGG